MTLGLNHHWPATPTAGEQGGGGSGVTVSEAEDGQLTGRRVTLGSLRPWLGAARVRAVAEVVSGSRIGTAESSTSVEWVGSWRERWEAWLLNIDLVKI